MGEVTAGVDCGTRAVRLVVRSGSEVIERRAVPTGLGRLGAAFGRLSLAGMERAFEVLAGLSQELDERGVHDRRVAMCPIAERAASSAGLPDKPETAYYGSVEEMVAGIRTAIGAPPRLLSPEERAGITFTGVAAEPAVASGYATVVDVTEWSTSLAGGSVGGGPASPELIGSVPVGALDLMKAHVRGDPPRAGELAALRAATADVAADLVRPADLSRGPLVLCGDVGAVLAAAALGSGSLDRATVHGQHLRVDEMWAVVDALSREHFELRIRRPGLEMQHADVILAAAMLAAAVVSAAGADTCVVSDAGLAEGLAFTATSAA